VRGESGAKIAASSMIDFPLSRRLLNVFAIFTAVFTWLAVISGGSVTSRNAGMAVPDWPTSFGYNMFLFPVSKWAGPIFYEHSHRLMASTVGILLIALVVGLMMVEPRRWVKVLGWCAIGAVCLQGVAGGLRVVLVEAQIGILHGILAQSLLVLISILAVVTSRTFVGGKWSTGNSRVDLRWLALALTLFVFVQLVVAATMRHSHAGLSIPDFPAAYGRILPDTSPVALDAINAQRAASVPAEPPTTAGLIWLQMTHRFIAAVILALAVVLVWRARHSAVRRLAQFLLGMILVQITLGICTIWFNKPADVATAHMALGALTLVASSLLAFLFFSARGALRDESLEFSPPPANYSRLSV
jgi:cytochrome c oxidase assembly protein subunit 15